MEIHNIISNTGVRSVLQKKTEVFRESSQVKVMILMMTLTRRSRMIYIKLWTEISAVPRKRRRRKMAPR